MHARPHHRAAIALLALCTIIGVPAAACAQEPGVIRYRVQPDLTAEEFVVSAELGRQRGDTIVYHFPIWAPGAYDIVNFGSYVHDFKATGASGRQLTVLRGDTNTFRIVAGSEPVNITYRVRDIEAPPSSIWFCTSDIEKHYVFAQGAALFGYPEGAKGAAHSVDYVVPEGLDIAVALDPITSGADAHVHSYSAPSYDDLIDAPVQMGKWQRADFQVNGVPHMITVTATSGKPSDTVNIAKLASVTKQIVEMVSGFFGDMPYKRYIFQHYIADMTQEKFQGAFGALEHASSSTYLSGSNGDGSAFADEVALTVAHEHWHVWSPKRFHVAELGPFNYQRAPRTKSLWFAEGLTEYYARILMIRSNLMSARAFLGEMGGDIRGVYGRGQGRSIADVSADISNAPLNESATALYSKGPVLGLLLDAEIRFQTGNAKSLDDAMRYFNREYGATGKTFVDDDIIPIMEKATGAKLEQFYSRYIAGTEMLPLDEYLRRLGFRYDSRMEKRPVFGVEAEMLANGMKILRVETGGTADASGLRAGDVVVKVLFKETSVTLSETPVEPSSIEMLARIPSTGFIVLRDGKEVELPFKRMEKEVPVRRLTLDESASPEALTIRNSLIGR